MTALVFQRGTSGWAADGEPTPAWWYTYEACGLTFTVGPFRSRHDATEAAFADDDVAPFHHDGDATQAGQ